MQDPRRRTSPKSEEPDETKQLLPLQGFREASQAVLELLSIQFPMSAWMVTRVNGERWIMLSVHDVTYGMKEGSTFRWSDSFCSKMTVNDGPRIAGDTQSVEVYRRSGINLYASIGSYVGVPILLPDGALFGTLCAIDPLAKELEATEVLPEVEVFSRILGGLIQSESERFERRLEALEERIQREVDSSTGVIDEALWEEIVALEDERCNTLGASCVVVSVMIFRDPTSQSTPTGGVGASLVGDIPSILKATLRPQDTVAQVGEAEFIEIIRDGRVADYEPIRERVVGTLRGIGADARVSTVVRDYEGGLKNAIDEARRLTSKL